ncbi:hypothetical protein M422DRAFT_64737 [Sphaerobolus stellatus SS14]|nr:hypothetical protein M422DRAFT_64737 [Sphaerobolus stellatus SS14]
MRFTPRVQPGCGLEQLNVVSGATRPCLAQPSHIAPTSPVSQEEWLSFEGFTFKLNTDVSSLPMDSLRHVPSPSTIAITDDQYFLWSTFNLYVGSHFSLPSNTMNSSTSALHPETTYQEYPWYPPHNTHIYHPEYGQNVVNNDNFNVDGVPYDTTVADFQIRSRRMGQANQPTYYAGNEYPGLAAALPVTPTTDATIYSQDPFNLNARYESSLPNDIHSQYETTSAYFTYFESCYCNQLHLIHEIAKQACYTPESQYGYQSAPQHTWSNSSRFSSPSAILGPYTPEINSSPSLDITGSIPANYGSDRMLTSGHERVPNCTPQADCQIPENSPNLSRPQLTSNDPIPQIRRQRGRKRKLDSTDITDALPRKVRWREVDPAAKTQIVLENSSTSSTPTFPEASGNKDTEIVPPKMTRRKAKSTRRRRKAANANQGIKICFDLRWSDLGMKVGDNRIVDEAYTCLYCGSQKITHPVDHFARHVFDEHLQGIPRQVPGRRPIILSEEDKRVVTEYAEKLKCGFCEMLFTRPTCVDDHLHRCEVRAARLEHAQHTRREAGTGMASLMQRLVKELGFEVAPVRYSDRL